MDVTVDIGELVLTGFAGINRDKLLAAFECELTRLVTERGVGSAAFDAEVTQAPQVPASASSQRLGTALARSVHSGLLRGAP
ncbi:hypothetical protein AB5J62_20330 [Amycolatopsis sp. cg5]|uniref:hypothetical protein n=1 Tax=Amycolatopsis sp. cg5 TaxID=3238802 RepID=UPI003524C483